MDVSCLLCSVPPQVWLAIHLVGIVLAVSSRGHDWYRCCAVCTNCLLAVSTAIVGVC